MIEGVRNTLFIRGNKSSTVVTSIMKDLVNVILFRELYVEFMLYNFQENMTFIHSKAEMILNILVKNQILLSFYLDHIPRRDPAIL